MVRLPDPEIDVRFTLLKVVIALGLTQIIGFGTLYYAFALIVPMASAEFGVRPSHLFAVFSLGFLLAGFAAPAIGRLNDKIGAARVMAVGSPVAAMLLLAICFAPNFPVFALLILLLELVALTILYDAAFAALARISGTQARRNITRLTLIAGFASTLFWPLTGWLVQEFGWRTTYGLFAAMHLCVAFPLHVWIARGSTHADKARIAEPATAPPFTPLRPDIAGKAFAALAVSFALSGLVISAMSVHMVGTLEASGLGAAATMVAMLMGPAQVLSRLIEAAAGSRYHPLWTAIISAASLPMAMLLIFLPLPPLAAGIAFVLLSGMGQGLSSIVRGTVPLALFGSHGFGGMLGRLAVVRTTLSAGAAYFFALSVETFGFSTTQLAFAVIGIIAIVPLPFLLWQVRRT